MTKVGDKVLCTGGLEGKVDSKKLPNKGREKKRETASPPGQGGEPGGNISKLMNIELWKHI